MAAQARLMEIRLAERKAGLVEVRDLARAWTETMTRCRTRLMEIVDDAKRRLPHLTDAQLGLIESLLVEAIEGLDEPPPKKFSLTARPL
jgi:phage terminase Nu1 subunit (DNA packaging protein)